MTDAEREELKYLVDFTVMRLAEGAVRGMLRDLCDPSELTDAEIDAMDPDDARAYLAEITYDDSDPAATRDHCAALAAL